MILSVFQRLLPLVLLGSSLVLPLSAEESAKPVAERPNILFLFADDMRFDPIAALDDRDVQTPHLDRLWLVVDRFHLHQLALGFRSSAGDNIQRFRQIPSLVRPQSEPRLHFQTCLKATREQPRGCCPSL